MDYLRLWIKLGLKYPKYYLDAYRALTLNYWFPDEESWIWDTRIFDNDFGVERTPLIIKNISLTTPLNLTMGKIPINSSVTLWILIICMGYVSIKNNRIAMIIYISILAIYVGLMFTSPTALFRYTYGAIVCIPLFLCLLYTKKVGEESNE